MLRNTRQRRAIREAFERAGRPLAPEEALAAAQSELGGLGVATVYRAIKTGVEEGWLIPVELPGAAPRYETSGKEHHHHFHCKGCGKVFEIAGCVENLKKLIPSGFEVTGHDVLLYGYCARCSGAVR
jgi:Fur family transcriptional regulator, ferric uptake regulator